jgi:hypothetical protein
MRTSEGRTADRTSTQGRCFASNQHRGRGRNVVAVRVATGSWSARLPKHDSPLTVIFPARPVPCLGPPCEVSQIAVTFDPIARLLPRFDLLLSLTRCAGAHNRTLCIGAAIGPLCLLDRRRRHTVLPEHGKISLDGTDPSLLCLRESAL